jgi:hypothetical protein
MVVGKFKAIKGLTNNSFSLYFSHIAIPEIVCGNGFSRKT